ncbi:zeta toxin family protein [Dermabacter hominis]|uniref:zeta toxin family protein n=1 Tax=Dermabacter hominis TaxID=36740 RepID=UPI003183BAA9
MSAPTLENNVATACTANVASEAVSSEQFDAVTTRTDVLNLLLARSEGWQASLSGMLEAFPTAPVTLSSGSSRDARSAPPATTPARVLDGQDPLTRLDVLESLTRIAELTEAVKAHFLTELDETDGIGRLSSKEDTAGTAVKSESTEPNEHSPADPEAPANLDPSDGLDSLSDKDRARVFAARRALAHEVSEFASLVHDESSKLVKQAFDAAVDEGTNIILDGVGASEKTLNSRLERLTATGYNVTIIDVECPREVSEASIQQRWEHGRTEALSASPESPLGGRWVPSGVLEKVFPNADGPSTPEVAHRNAAHTYRVVSAHQLWRRTSATSTPECEQNLVRAHHGATLIDKDASQALNTAFGTRPRTHQNSTDTGLER